MRVNAGKVGPLVRAGVLALALVLPLSMTVARAEPQSTPSPPAAASAAFAASAPAAVASTPSTASAPSAPSAADDAGARPDGQHDFDFEIGTWKTRLSVLRNPLTDSSKWVEYEGTTVVRAVWGGRANLVELEADGPAGHIEALSLRLYDPQTREWSLNFANGRTGTLSPPSIGGFRDGRGEFYSDETLDGRPIRVRFVISPVDEDTVRFEQAFSADGGRTWEVNWKATDTRID